MGITYTVISIGTLSSNPFWEEPPGLRTAHATTTLVVDGERKILVDPSLPAAALVSRLFERTGLTPEAITDVFCTTLRPTHRRAIAAFASARWLCAPLELDAFNQHLTSLAEAASRGGHELEQTVAAEMELLQRFTPAVDKLSEAVHLFPLPGPSAGSAGLLLAGPMLTVMVAGDAAPTRDHVLAGRVWSGSVDTKSAMDSITEVIEIADFIICGHDNIMPNPTRWMA